MSTKDDRDNRSNQLNPNNDAYWSSRAAADDCDDEDGESPWIQQEGRARSREAEEQAVVKRGCLDLDLVGSNGRWVRLRCGEGANGSTHDEALGNWFSNCMTAYQEEWECDIAYAQLYENRRRSHMFLRRPDLAGMQMSAEAETGLAEARAAEEAEQPRVHPIFSYRGAMELVCAVEQWPPVLAELRAAPRGRVFKHRPKPTRARMDLLARGQSLS